MGGKEGGESFIPNTPRGISRPLQSKGNNNRRSERFMGLGSGLWGWRVVLGVDKETMGLRKRLWG